METKEMSRNYIAGKEPVCYGYKAVKWDGKVWKQINGLKGGQE